MKLFSILIINLLSLQEHFTTKKSKTLLNIQNHNMNSNITIPKSTHVY